MVESMNGNIVERILALGEAGVAGKAGASTVERGKAIDAMDMDALQFTGEEFYAQVMGTNPYLVKLWLELDDGAEVADRLSVDCTCPVRALWCKHVVAVALRMIEDPEWARSAPAGEIEEPDAHPTRRYGDVEVSTVDVVTSTLGIMNKQELVEVINELRGQVPLVEPFVSKLVLPYSSQPFPGLHEIQTQIENTRIMFEMAHTDSGVVDAADQLSYTGNLIRSYAGGPFDTKLLAALEQLMFKACNWALAIALPVGPIVDELSQLHQHHVAMAHWEKLSASHVIDWLLDTYFAPGWYLPAQVKDYVDLLDEDDLESLVKQAHERSPLHPERVLELECDVAAVRDDLPRLKALMEHTDTQDKLYRYYDSKGMTDEATELVDAALMVDKPVELSPPVRYEAARKHLGEPGEYRFYLHRFVAEPNYKTFADFMAVDIVDYDKAVDAYYQSVAHTGVKDMNYALLAAIEFGNFQGGFLAFTVGSDEHWVGEALHPVIVGEFAQKVAMPVDPVFALALIFVQIRAHMHLAMGTWSEKTAAHYAVDPELDHITELYQLISDSPAAIRAWRREVERVEQEFRGHPEVVEGIADRGFMRWGCDDGGA